MHPIVVTKTIISMMILDTMQPSDWEDVKRIFEEGIPTGNATFQKEAPGWEE